MLARIIFGVILAFPLSPSRAETGQDQAAPYKGKTITVITGTGVGGTYDLVARLIARHMPRNIPGHPTMIVQNMPGGGNVLATNYMYNIAPKDGTVIATIHSAMPLHQVLDGQGVRYDADNFFFQAEDGIRDGTVTGVQTCALPI